MGANDRALRLDHDGEIGRLKSSGEWLALGGAGLEVAWHCDIISVTRLDSEHRYTVQGSETRPSTIQDAVDVEHSTVADMAQ